MKNFNLIVNETEILEKINNAVSGETGTKYLEALTAFLSNNFGLEYAFVGELVKSPEPLVNTVAVFANGQIADNFSYLLRDTPCENVMGQKACAYPNSVQSLFPNDELLVEMETEGYLGAPLFKTNGEPMGIMVILSTSPLENQASIEACFNMVAARTAAEMERVEIEEELLRSQKKFSGLVNSANISVWEEDFSELYTFLKHLKEEGVEDIVEYAKGHRDFYQNLAAKIRVSSVNRATLALFGAKNEAEMLSSIQETFGKDAIEVFKKEVFAIWNGESSFQSEANFKKLDGETFTAIVSLPLPTNEVEAASIPVCLTDISDRIEMENEIKEKQRHYSSIIKTTRDGFWVVDRTGRILESNEAYSLMSEYSLQELDGMRISDFDAQMSDEDIQERILYVIEHGSAVFETKHRAKSGRLFDVEVSTSFSNDNRGVFFAFLRDTSEKKRREKQLEDYRTHLEETVETRTRSLLDAKQEADAANRAKTNFLANMSHELRTPLNGVLGFAQLLEQNSKEPLSETQKHYVQKVLKAGGHLLSLLDEVLDISKIEAGRSDLVFNTIDVHRISGECIELNTAKAISDSVTLINRIDEVAPPTVRADETRLKQILINFISNAIKYNRPGGTVVIEIVSKDSDKVKIGVRDSGLGIAKDLHQKVFEPFERLSAERRNAIEGTGLGLALSKNLAERMGGAVGFESEEGVGSLFWVSLPESKNYDSVSWSSDLSVGVAAIDEDHKELIERLDLLAGMVAKGEAIDSHMVDLFEALSTHFSNEEAYMEEVSFVGREVHKEIHQWLIVKARQALTKTKGHSNPEDVSKHLRYMRSWLLEHIILVDSELKGSSN